MFIRMFNEPNLVTGATPFARWVERFEAYCSEMVFEPGRPSCYPCGDLSADETHPTVSKRSGVGEVYGTTDWTASTLPRKLGNGKTPGG
jgi:hypothetical protein